MAISGVDGWMQASLADFFAMRPKPSQKELDGYAASLVPGSTIHPVGMQGSLSYTVVAVRSGRKIIVSFRMPGSKLGGRIEKAVQNVHGKLVPVATFRGTVSSQTAYYEPLKVYSMPCLEGKPYLEAVYFGPQERRHDIIKHTVFIKDLAKYFARCWTQPQAVDLRQLETKRKSISQKLSLLEDARGYEFLRNTLTQLRGPQGIVCLYSGSWLQVVTHGDLSQTNILVDPETLSITGLVDWSLATVAPFGLELSALRRMSGSMFSDGWTDQPFRPQTEAAFWAEFWRCTGIEDTNERESVRKMAELGCKLGVILRYAFCNTLGGVALNQVVPRPAQYLRSWLGHEAWSDVIIKDSPEPYRICTLCLIVRMLKDQSSKTEKCIQFTDVEIVQQAATAPETADYNHLATRTGTMADPEVPKSLSTIPMELLGSALDHIVDEGTMSALGRTNKAFYSIVMPRLFKRVYIEEARDQP
ncbi:uncharacterized protein PG986_000577 [Apiospora aurea]|uniref:Aminoglycoside phosphotransferase domain-containing protein n=1 Tax=Apiospora aurea TaxID=335848 RepID=A0ABR1QW38_9PEZI